MYTAKVNGQRIDVDDISISFRLKNPMFDDNSGMDWSATYPFKLPATDRNKNIFGYPSRTNRTLSGTEYTFEHQFNGMRLPGDLIRVTQSTDDFIEVYVKLGRSKFISTFKDTTLDKLLFPLEEYQTGDAEGENYFWDGMNKSYPETKFSLCTIKNEGFFNGTAYEATWNDPVLNPSGPYQNLIYQAGTTFVYNHRCITPLPFLVAVIEQIFSDAALIIGENPFLSDEELASLSIFNPNRIDFDATYIPESKNIRFTLSDHLPRITIPGFFISLRAGFGIDLYFNFFTNKVDIITRESVITNAATTDWQDKVLPYKKVYLTDVISRIKLSMINDGNDAEWAQNVPEQGLFIGHTIDQYTEIADLPATSVIGTLSYVFENDSIYEYVYDDETDANIWRQKTLNLLDYITGADPQLTIEGNIGALSQKYHQYAGLNLPADWYWATPVVNQPGNAGSMPLSGNVEYNDFSLRLIFHRKYSFSSDERIYILGSSFNYDYWAHEVGDPAYSLRWDGEISNANPLYYQKGLWYKFWANWINWRSSTQMIEFQKILTVVDIAQIDFSKKYFALNTVMILDEINFTVTNTQIKPANVKAWTV